MLTCKNCTWYYHDRFNLADSMEMVKMRKNLLVVTIIILVCNFITEPALADANQQQKIYYYVIMQDIGDYSGMLTLLKTYRELIPNDYTLYAIRDDVEKDMWLAMTDYFDWAIFSYFYKDETTDTTKRISLEQFQNYIKKIKF